MIQKDLYDILNIDQKASSDEIKKAYKRQALKKHPDKRKQEEDQEKVKEEFLKVQLAYEVLSDNHKRIVYDQTGQIPNKNNGPDDLVDIHTAFSDLFQGFFNPFQTSSDISQLFNLGGNQHAAKYEYRNPNLPPLTPPTPTNTIQKFTLQELFEGCEKELEITRHVGCKKCNEEGSLPCDRGSCTQCMGSGNLSTKRQMGNIFMMTNELCKYCLGRGISIEKYCSKCNGYGHQAKTKNVKLKVDPQTYTHNDTIPLDSDSFKDYSITVSISNFKHGKYFYKNEEPHNLWYNLVIPYTSSIAGFKKDIRLLDNHIFSLQYNKSILTSNTILRFKNYGLTYKGYLCVNIIINNPPLNVSREDKLTIKTILDKYI
eukprot:Pgem_evm2s16871